MGRGPAGERRVEGVWLMRGRPAVGMPSGLLAMRRRQQFRQDGGGIDYLAIFLLEVG